MALLFNVTRLVIIIKEVQRVDNKIGVMFDVTRPVYNRIIKVQRVFFDRAA